MTKTTGQDDIDTNNEGTDDNDNDDYGDQGIKTDDEKANDEDNHHRMATGTGRETGTDNNTT